MMKQNKHEPFLVNSQVQQFVLSSIQCQYSQVVVIVFNVTVQLSILGCLPPLLLTVQNGHGTYTDRGF